MAATDKFLVSKTLELEPLTVTVGQCSALTGESRSKVYLLIAEGRLDAVKSGSRTLIKYASIKQHIANLPKAEVKPPKREQPAA
jgi:excisionase family DNA binding protein